MSVNKGIIWHFGKYDFFMTLQHVITLSLYQLPLSINVILLQPDKLTSPTSQVKQDVSSGGKKKKKRYKGTESERVTSVRNQVKLTRKALNVCGLWTSVWRCASAFVNVCVCVGCVWRGDWGEKTKRERKW